MTVAQAVLLYNLAVAMVFATDFIVSSRRNSAVIAKVPAAILALVLAVLAARVEQGAVEFAAIGVLVLLAAMFGYANFLAFVKRGITFSILQNHARPRGERRPDRDFIFLEDRIEEMRGHGWIAGDATGWRLNDRGRRVVRIRRALLRMLGSEAVG